jgi:hypothetical protein
MAFPPLTPDGLRKLAVQLDKDRQLVLASPAPLHLKSSIHDQINKLQDFLNAAASMSTAQPPPPPDWGPIIGPAFSRLVGDMGTALNLGPDDIGACKYSNPDGCIQCTQGECDELGGTWFPNTPC